MRPARRIDIRRSWFRGKPRSLSDLFARVALLSRFPPARDYHPVAAECERARGRCPNFKSQIFNRIVMRWNCRRGGRNDETGHFGNVVIHRYASGKKPVGAESNGSAPRLLPLHRGKNQDDRCQRLPGNVASFDWTATRERSALVVRTVRTLITVRTSSASSSPVAWCRSLKQRSKNAI